MTREEAIKAQPESKSGKRIETLDISTERNWKITKVVDISTDSIEAIADAVVRRLRGEQDG